MASKKNGEILAAKEQAPGAGASRSRKKITREELLAEDLARDAQEKPRPGKSESESEFESDSGASASAPGGWELAWDRYDYGGVPRLGKDQQHATEERKNAKPFEVVMESFSKHKAKLSAALHAASLPVLGADDSAEKKAQKRRASKMINKINLDFVNMYALCSTYHFDACATAEKWERMERPSLSAQAVAVLLLLAMFWCATRVYYTKGIAAPAVEGAVACFIIVAIKALL